MGDLPIDLARLHSQQVDDQARHLRRFAKPPRGRKSGGGREPGFRHGAMSPALLAREARHDAVRGEAAMGLLCGER